MFFPSLVSHSDARTTGLRGGFRNSSPVTQKWRKVTKKTVLLNLGLAEDGDGNLDGYFFILKISTSISEEKLALP